MDPETNKQLVKRLFDAWSAGEIRPLVDAMSEDFRWVFPGRWSWSGTWEPKAAVVSGLLRGQLATQFRERYESHPDFFLADEDRVVVQTRGHTTTVRGEAYDNTYCLIFRLNDDGAVTEIIEHCDTSLVDRVLAPPSRDAYGWTPARCRRAVPS